MSEYADIILVRGMLFPASLEKGVLLSLAIFNGSIVYVGSESGAASWMGPRTQRINLDGKTVIPGFVDAHMHPLLGGLQLLDCNLSGLFSLPEYQRAISDYAGAHSACPLIRGGGWTSGAFPSAGPSKEALDAVSPDRPVLLKAMDGHSMWVNSPVLRQAGIHAGTPQPAGGEIIKDARTGEPTGWLKEWSAMELAESCFPPVTPEECLCGARAFMEKAASAGITSVFDAMVTEKEFRAYSELESRGELTVRMQGAALWRPQDDDATRQRILQWLQRPPSDCFRLSAVKLFADGVVEAHTAWLKEPYTDQPNHRGTLIWAEDRFCEEVDRWDRLGAGLHIHAIGDGAAQLAVDALERAIQRNGARAARHQLAHLDLVDPGELSRMKQYGIIAVVQPAWFYVDHGFFDTTLPFLGRDRAFRQYPLNTMLRRGVQVAYGSDWPYGGDSAAFSPLEGIQVGATRLGVGGDYPTVYVPEERVPVCELLDLCTRRGAYALGRERELGTLAPGMRADIVVLDADLFQTPVQDIHKMNVLLTLVDGRPVYTAPVWRGLQRVSS